ncbi:MAG TPA: hypothetical protein VFT29_00835 [Gemmatimonadaceae bacterium]|nr:hypothetical protein [Gemmatimonadaceae bacterium]
MSPPLSEPRERLFSSPRYSGGRNRGLERGDFDARLTQTMQQTGREQLVTAAASSLEGERRYACGQCKCRARRLVTG